MKRIYSWGSSMNRPQHPQHQQLYHDYPPYAPDHDNDEEDNQSFVTNMTASTSPTNLATRSNYVYSLQDHRRDSTASPSFSPHFYYSHEDDNRGMRRRAESPYQHYQHQHQHHDERHEIVDLRHDYYHANYRHRQVGLDVFDSGTAIAVNSVNSGRSTPKVKESRYFDLTEYSEEDDHNDVVVSNDDLDVDSEDGYFESDDRLSRMRRQGDLVDLTSHHEDDLDSGCIDLTQVPSILDDLDSQDEEVQELVEEVASESSMERDWEIRHQLRRIDGGRDNDQNNDTMTDRSDQQRNSRSTTRSRASSMTLQINNGNGKDNGDANNNDNNQNDVSATLNDSVSRSAFSSAVAADTTVPHSPRGYAELPSVGFTQNTTIKLVEAEYDQYCYDNDVHHLPHQRHTLLAGVMDVIPTSPGYHPSVTYETQTEIQQLKSEVRMAHKNITPTARNISGIRNAKQDLLNLPSFSSSTGKRPAPSLDRNPAIISVDSSGDPPGALEYKPSLLLQPSSTDEEVPKKKLAVEDPPTVQKQTIATMNDDDVTNSDDAERSIIGSENNSKDREVTITGPECRPVAVADRNDDDDDVQNTVGDKTISIDNALSSVSATSSTSRQQRDCPAFLMRQSSDPAPPASPSLKRAVNAVSLNDIAGKNELLIPTVDKTLPSPTCFLQHQQAQSLPTPTNKVHEIIIIDESHYSNMMATSTSSSSSQQGRESRDAPMERPRQRQMLAKPIRPTTDARATMDQEQVLPKDNVIQTWIPSPTNLRTVMRGVPAFENSDRRKNDYFHTKHDSDGEEDSAAESLLSQLLDDSMHEQSISYLSTLSRDYKLSQPNECVASDELASQLPASGNIGVSLSNVCIIDDASETTNIEDEAHKSFEDDDAGTSQHELTHQDNADDEARRSGINSERKNDEIVDKHAASSDIGGIRHLLVNGTSFEIERQDTLSSTEIYCEIEEQAKTAAAASAGQRELINEKKKREVKEEDDKEYDPYMESILDCNTSGSDDIQEAITNDLEEEEEEEEEGYDKHFRVITNDFSPGNAASQDSTMVDAEATYASFCLAEETEETPEEEPGPCEPQEKVAKEESEQTAFNGTDQGRKLGSLLSLWEERFQQKKRVVDQGVSWDEETIPSDNNEGETEKKDFVEATHVVEDGYGCAGDFTEEEITEDYDEIVVEEVVEEVIATDDEVDVPVFYSRKVEEGDQESDVFRQEDLEARGFDDSNYQEPRDWLPAEQKETAEDASQAAATTEIPVHEKKVSFKEDIAEISIIHPFKEKAAANENIALDALADVWNTKMAKEPAINEYNAFDAFADVWHTKMAGVAADEASAQTGVKTNEQCTNTEEEVLSQDISLNQSQGKQQNSTKSCQLGEKAPAEVPPEEGKSRNTVVSSNNKPIEEPQKELEKDQTVADQPKAAPKTNLLGFKELFMKAARTGILREAIACATKIPQEDSRPDEVRNADNMEPLPEDTSEDRVNFAHEEEGKRGKKGDNKKGNKKKKGEKRRRKKKGDKKAKAPKGDNDPDTDVVDKDMREKAKQVFAVAASVAASRRVEAPLAVVVDSYQAVCDESSTKDGMAEKYVESQQQPSSDESPTRDETLTIDEDKNISEVEKSCETSSVSDEENHCSEPQKSGGDEEPTTGEETKSFEPDTSTCEAPLANGGVISPSESEKAAACSESTSSRDNEVSNDLLEELPQLKSDSQEVSEQIKCEQEKKVFSQMSLLGTFLKQNVSSTCAPKQNDDKTPEDAKEKPAGGWTSFLFDFKSSTLLSMQSDKSSASAKELPQEEVCNPSDDNDIDEPFSFCDGGSGAPALFVAATPQTEETTKQNLVIDDDEGEEEEDHDETESLPQTLSELGSEDNFCGNKPCSVFDHLIGESSLAGSEDKKYDPLLGDRYPTNEPEHSTSDPNTTCLNIATDEAETVAKEDLISGYIGEVHETVDLAQGDDMCKIERTGDCLLNMSFDQDSKGSTVSALNDDPNESPAATLDMERLQVLVTSLMTHEHGFEFSTPLDLKDFPDYSPDTSKYHPMDLGTILRNLINGDYGTILEFQSDVNMTFNFRMKYSRKGSKVYKTAKSLKKKFEKDLLKLLDDLEKELIGPPDDK